MNLSLEAFDDLFKRIKNSTNDEQSDTLINLRLLHTVRQLATAYYNCILAQYDLTEVEFLAMLVLYTNEKDFLQPSELSGILDLTRTAATRLGDKLVRQGRISRKTSKTDRRSVQLNLTEKGRSLVKDIMPVFTEARHKMWQDLTDKEIESMQKSMRKLINRINIEMENLK